MEPENPTVLVPPPSQPVVPSVPPIFPKKNNLVVILLCVLLLITLSTTGYLFLQVQSLTKQLAQVQVQVQATPIPSPAEASAQEGAANWKTYTDPVLKFSIQYPNDMTLEKTNNDIYLSLVSFKNDNTQFSVYVSKGNVKNTVEQIRAQTEGHVVTTLVKNEAFQINGIDGWLLEYTPQSGNINRSTVIIPNKTNVYVINAQSDVFDQILSTFRFLK